MAITDFLFPKFCLGCGYVGSYFCPHCQKDLRPILRPTCLYCQKASYLGLTHPGCLKKLDINGVVTIFQYNHFLKKVIKNIKYRLATSVWNDFWQLVDPKALEPLFLFKKIIYNGVLQPIPLAEKKLRNRGFNQADFILEYFQRFLPLPKTNFIIRKKETRSQAQLEHKKDRYLNLRGAFTLIDKKIKLTDKTIILVDDVLTTGSTIKEACRVLKRAGANKVYGLILARG